MKGRPRRIEREVALHLSKYLATLGMGPVERIPVLGRTGPDVDVFPGLQIAVDVKSRKAIPKSYKLYGKHIQTWVDPHEEWDGWRQIGCRLCDLDLLFDAENVSMHLERRMSSTIAAWLNHMSQWCGIEVVKEAGKPMVVSEPDNIPALVLHWPGTPVKNSTFLIYEPHRSLIDDRRRECLNNLQLSAS